MRVGDVIDGKYEVVRMLGEGGMGRVYAARHAVLGAAVAIKVLKRAGDASAEVARRFLREARAAVRLTGEHVARVLDVGQLSTGEPYMVMELLEGTDLASMLARSPLSSDVAARYVVEACRGVAEAHRHGIIHRDLKPSNLFLASRPPGAPVVKVLDFGIATAANDELDRGMTSTQSLLGSPAYMSPEQLRSSKHVDARSDVWSLGVTLYELVSGRHPFRGQTFAALSIAIATEPHPGLDAPRDLAAIVDRCLAKEPDDRYASADALADALERFTAARTTGQLAGESVPRPRARGTWPLIASLCAAGGISVIALVVSVRDDDAPPARAAPATVETSSGGSASSATRPGSTASEAMTATPPAIEAVTAAPPASEAVTAAPPASEAATATLPASEAVTRSERGVPTRVARASGARAATVSGARPSDARASGARGAPSDATASGARGAPSGARAGSAAARSAPPSSDATGTRPPPSSDATGTRAVDATGTRAGDATGTRPVDATGTRPSDATGTRAPPPGDATGTRAPPSGDPIGARVEPPAAGTPPVEPKPAPRGCKPSDVRCGL